MSNGRKRDQYFKEYAQQNPNLVIRMGSVELKDQVRAAAKDAGLSVTDWVLEAIKAKLVS